MEMNSMEDWEAWVKLFRENPEAFEKERRLAIEEVIMDQPVHLRRRSRQLQWRIDAVRRRAPNSLAACVRIYDMLLDAFYGPGGLVEVLQGGVAEPLVKGPGINSKKAGICLKLQRPWGKNPGT
jgi:hypothetical protein